MRFSTLTVGLLAALAPMAAAWTKEDREIFRVRDELAAALGPEITFYDFVGVPPSASLDDINKAYRKKTRQLHPDKVKQQLAADRAKAAKKEGSGKTKPGVNVAKGPSPGEVRAAVKRASEMQARLSIVTNVLRGPERDRYDHFLANGFPVWKGTEYYYNRYRPGFGTVLFGLFVFVGGGAHYIALYMSWKRQREFVDRYIRYARQAAWGNQFGGVDLGGDFGADPSMGGRAAVDTGAADDEPQPNVAMNRKQRRMQERDAKRDATREGAGSRRAARRGLGTNTSGAGSSGTATPTAQPGAGPTGAKKRVVAENGKILVVDSLGDVYLEQVDEEGKVEELLLDINEVARPTFKDTAVYRLPVWLFGLTAGRLLGGKTGADEANIEDEQVDREDTPLPRKQAKATRKAKPARPAPAAAAVSDVDDSESSPGKATPSTDSQEDFELLEASTGSLKATGSSHNKVKANKRKGKKK
ncbi:hypothetical protein SPBR_07130 [Sporothrix brasiliensis 5110]|uniref:J domain-containing protein n=1 Tax=Sporothrix brasiliensis 5110 TaxID=1398154 RepID=A0A0C2IN84_9PEZI|nr:uncharacterized protein SPBR_07130 [Sporothrix brasiliensis 5110]KIH88440.1 hypothetical protein SPBR_07130 [Sporothrix brasiliensis 5110]